MKLACAYYAYALGQYDECLAYLLNTSYPETLAPIPDSVDSRSTRTSTDGPSSLFKFHFHHHTTPVTLKDDRTSFITESVRAFCLEGTLVIHTITSFVLTSPIYLRNGTRKAIPIES